MNRRTLWQTRFQELLWYTHRDGHCDVPREGTDNPKLGEGINTQRRHYILVKEGKKSKMKENRIIGGRMLYV